MSFRSPDQLAVAPLSFVRSRGERGLVGLWISQQGDDMRCRRLLRTWSRCSRFWAAHVRMATERAPHDSLGQPLEEQPRAAARSAQAARLGRSSPGVATARAGSPEWAGWAGAAVRPARGLGRRRYNRLGWQERRRRRWQRRHGWIGQQRLRRRREGRLGWQGAIILGTGGDNGDGGTGTWFEGAITFGAPPDSVDDAIQANIVAAGCGR
jgi:hypothetical protein